ncbi:MAG: ABC transporter ATP-binding protein [Gammaproteobacteria bacterium]|nr:ABC transporter ATP-binding protein [Gammaproteobacteria bacterium]
MIHLEGIRRDFRLGEQTVHALAGIDLDIAAGEYVSIMGPSGSGKSTLLNVVALLDRPDAGSYAFDGVDVTAFDDDALARVRRENIGFVFQFFHLIPRLTAFQNVEVPLVLASVPVAERRERVNEALASLDLSSRAHHRPNELSGGQRQRVAIARATIMRPKVLLADEPTGNLDSVSGRQVIEIIENLNAANGVTLIVVTHDSAMGSRASRQLRLVDGRIDSDQRR